MITWFELGRKKGEARSWIVFQMQGLNENIVSYMVCNGNKLSIQKGKMVFSDKQVNICGFFTSLKKCIIN